MYESWLLDNEEEIDKLRHHGILIGSFYNSEAAKQMMATEKPTYATSDEEFEKSTAMVIKAGRDKLAQQSQEQQKGHRRKRRKPVKDV